MKWTRRDVLKGLGGLPIVGGIWWAGAANSLVSNNERIEREEILAQLNIQPSLLVTVPPVEGNAIRVGIIGFGIRGEQLCRALGFATKKWLENMKNAVDENPNHTALKDFQNQEKLNVTIVGVCDVFDFNANRVIDSFSTESQKVLRYSNYQEMIKSGNVDAVIIATPDHWHAPMAIEALNNGVSAYVEKPMTHTVEETYRLREAARNSSAKLMVGHQHRQTLSFKTAQDIEKREH